MNAKPVNLKLNKIFTIAECIVAGIFTLIFLTLFILTGACLLRSCICMAWLLFMLYHLIFKENKQSYVICLAEILIISPIVLFLSLWAPIMINTHFAFRYPFQKSYIEIFSGDDTFDYFPSKLPYGVKNYRLDYLPSIMQGVGYTTMSFEASDDVIEQYMNEYSKGAIYTCTVADLGESLSIQINENGANNTNKYADVHMSESFRKKCSGDAMVYIMYNSEDSHRSPYTSAVIIDSEHNLIEFSKIG